MKSNNMKVGGTDTAPSSFDSIQAATGMSDEAISDVIRYQGMVNSVIWLGLDSLTAGAGGFSYNLPLEKLARGVVGWGGRIVPFLGSGQSSSLVFESGYGNNSNTRLIRELPVTSNARIYSLADRGIYCDGSVAGFLNAEITPEFNWVSADIYYLQQPDGGTFDIDMPVTYGTIDTAGDFEVKKVTVCNDTRGGSNSVRCYNLNVGTGKNVVIYETVFKSGDSGPIWLNTAEGGRTTKNQSGNESGIFNQSIQKKWNDLLGVTHAVVKGGTNDAAADETAAEFSLYLGDLVNGSLSDVKTIIVRPTQPNPAVTDMSTYVNVYESYAKNSFGYIDLVSDIGDYYYCENAGIMLDDYHATPNYHYLESQIVCKKLFGRSFYIDTPPLLDYTATDTQTQIDGSFKALV